MAIDLHKELLTIRREALALGAIVEERVRMVAEAIETGDVELARQVKRGDKEIDDAEVHIESECLRVLALGGPVASDLRFVLGVMRVTSQLERIGDLARSISKRVINVNILPTVELPGSLVDLAHAARAMLSDALAAMSNEDAALCREVRAADERVDDLRKEVFYWARDEMPRRAEASQAIIDILSMAQKLERIGDLANNIAGDVIFLVEGSIVRHSKA
ncbi:MAG TPA: phosphate signaling complex protein PhoU [Phycisphaerales bacterium]|nr:phosphate signaling complex protein PhoU [Phycisphaerales bacterium]HMP35925.1 phosphate signaling complex protein PhoU [Phycisphaerales bacterium]